MRISRLILITLVFFILTQCNENKDHPIFLKNLITNEQNEFIKYDAFYIIPPTICASCNSHVQKIAYLILKENYHAKVIFDYKILN